MPVRRVGLLAAVLASALTGRAWAAQISVTGAEACFDAEALADQAGELLGRSLASVTGVDFAVGLTRAQKGTWKLRLDTLDGSEPDHGRRSRELTATSCTELADAAAVAIALTVRSRVPPSPLPSPPPYASSSSPSTASAPPLVVTRPPLAPPASPTTVAVGLAVVGDAGALPNPGIGIELGASLRLRGVRIALAGTALAAQVTHTTGDVGGEFRLLFGSAEVCLPRAVRPSSPTTPRGGTAMPRRTPSGGPPTECASSWTRPEAAPSRSGMRRWIPRQPIRTSACPENRGDFMKGSSTRSMRRPSRRDASGSR